MSSSTIRTSGSTRFICASKLAQSSPRKSSKMMKPPLSRYARRFAASSSVCVQYPASAMYETGNFMRSGDPMSRITPPTGPV